MCPGRNPLCSPAQLSPFLTENKERFTSLSPEPKYKIKILKPNRSTKLSVRFYTCLVALISNSTALLKEKENLCEMSLLELGIFLLQLHPSSSGPFGPLCCFIFKYKNPNPIIFL